MCLFHANYIWIVLSNQALGQSIQGDYYQATKVAYTGSYIHYKWDKERRGISM